MIDKLKCILEEYVGLDGIDVTRETLISSEIGLSSLEYFEFIGEVQDEFGIKISDKELLKMRSVGDLIEAIEAKIS